MNACEGKKLEHQLCFSLYVTAREIIKLYKPVLDPFHLTYTQYITMLALWEEEKMTVKGLGQKLHLDSGTLTPLLKKLECMKLITKYRDRQDDRVVIVELTTKGRALEKAMNDVPQKIGCQVDLSKEQVALVKQTLDQILVQISG